MSPASQMFGKFLTELSIWFGMVAPLFTVCLMERSEGAGQIETLLERNPDVAIDAIASDELPGFETCIQPEGWVQTTPAHLSDQGGVDGFFIARLLKK